MIKELKTHWMFIISQSLFIISFILLKQYLAVIILLFIATTVSMTLAMYEHKVNYLTEELEKCKKKNQK